MNEKPVVQTTVEQVEGDLADIFQLGSSTSTGAVTNPVAVAKPNIFSRENTDMSFLDAGTPTETKESTSSAATTAAAKVLGTEQTPASVERQLSLEAILKEGTGTGQQSPEADGAPGSNTATSGKGTLSGTFSKLIEAGTLIPFDDAKPLDEYSPKDFEELLQANFQERDKKSLEEISTSFFQSLPKELQYAAKYVQDGGQDLKGLFQALSHVEQVKDLDPEKTDDQEAIYRQYLTAIGFGSPEEVEEELCTWKDLGQLDKKAKQAKPKLDKLREQQVTRQLEQQEQLKEQNEAAARAYVDQVYQALQPGQLNGLKLDKKTQHFLYNAMVQPAYPSLSGRPTNLLGHLLEKYQYTEPNYSLIAEAVWLLSDPEGYRAKLVQTGANQESLKTARTLKTEEGRRPGSEQRDEPATAGSAPSRKLSRPGNIFQR